jgi:hypothetical protein
MDASLNHPLWSRLVELDTVARRRFSTQLDRGFGGIGLRLNNPPEQYDYWCTPTNVVTFASTGGDGVHFSFLVQDDEITEQSPIVITVPGAFDGPNWIGGRDLYEFLCLGSLRGFFALGEIAYTQEEALRILTDQHWHPTEDQHYSVGYVPNEEESPILDFLVGQLALKPWPHASHFSNLQARYGGLLELPT